MSMVEIRKMPADAFMIGSAPKFIDSHNLHGLYDKLLTDPDPKSLILHGPKGVSKTLSIQSYANKKKIPLISVECSEDTRKTALVGTFVMENNITPFVLGDVTNAIEVANEVGLAILCFEEVNALPPQIQKMLNSITDFRKSVNSPECKKVFRLNPGARLWVTGTMNACFHPATDVLTPDGVRKVTDLKAGDPVYSFNMETGKCELDSVVRVWENQAEKLVKVSNEHVSLRITPNHNMVVSRAYKPEVPWVRRTCGEMADRCKDLSSTNTYFEYPKPFDLPDGVEQEIIDLEPLARAKGWVPETNKKYSCVFTYKMDDFLDLLGWYISEGSTTSIKKGTYVTSIAQDKPHGQVKIKAVLDRMGVRSSPARVHGKQKAIVFNDKVLYHALIHFGGRYSDGKFISHDLFSLSKRQLRILFTSMYDGDGDERNERKGGFTGKNRPVAFRSGRYSTKSVQLYKDTLWLATYLGYTTTRHAEENDGVGMYRVGLRDAKPATKHLRFEEQEYSGTVIDVEIKKNHTLCAGEDGKFLMVSNSHYGGVYSLNEDFKSRFLFKEIPYPSEADEITILKTLYPAVDVKIIKGLAVVASDLRSGNTIGYKLSTRDLAQWVEMIPLLGMRSAVDLVSGKYETQTDKSVFMSRCRAVFTELGK
jgi:hypothetical protein